MRAFLNRMSGRFNWDIANTLSVLACHPALCRNHPQEARPPHQLIGL